MTSLAFETADGYVLQIVAEWFQRSINHPVGRRHDRTCYANEKTADSHYSASNSKEYH